MEKKVKSILEELCDYTPKEDRELIIEYRANQIVASAINLLNLIKETYDEDTADDLSRRLLRSIQSGDEEKFNRKIRSIRESKIEKQKKE